MSFYNLPNTDIQLNCGVHKLVASYVLQHRKRFQGANPQCLLLASDQFHALLTDLGTPVGIWHMINEVFGVPVKIEYSYSVVKELGLPAAINYLDELEQI